VKGFVCHGPGRGPPGRTSPTPSSRNPPTRSCGCRASAPAGAVRPAASGCTASAGVGVAESSAVCSTASPRPAWRRPGGAARSTWDGFGTDVAIEVVGVPESFELCTRVARPGGHVAGVRHLRPGRRHRRAEGGARHAAAPVVVVPHLW